MKNYVIFDINSPIFTDRPIFEGKNSHEAVIKYLLSKGIKSKIKRDGGSNSQIQAEQFEITNGIKYKTGKSVWYKLIN